MPGGQIWGALFFLFMIFAALSTVVAVFENIISFAMDKWNCDRKKACLINGILLFALSLPCVLGFNVLSAIAPFGEGSTIMDLEDFVVSNLLLPIGSLCFTLFCVTRYGWGWKKFKEEANTGKGLKVANWMRIHFTFVLPVIIIILFVVGIYNFFK
jgi:NSS family neurotransmitter:Na+ symporter